MTLLFVVAVVFISLLFNQFMPSGSVGNRGGKSQSVIRKVKPIDYRLYNRISHN